MPKIVAKTITVVEDGGLRIDELAGNASSGDDTLSIARVTVSEPASEPWLTLHYDEWMCVLKGKVEIHFFEFEEAKLLTVEEGETVFIAKGERFRPIFPVGGTEYIPVCLPAFRPDRCIREEEGDEPSEVVKRLEELHSVTTPIAPPPTADPSKEVLYHMCLRSQWEEALNQRRAYYPPTYKEDGNFTHATAVPSRLIVTANHFYTTWEGDWICVQLSARALSMLGITTVFEEPKPVGVMNVSDEWTAPQTGTGGGEDGTGEGGWICPHIYGGIPAHVPGVVTKIYPMVRDDKGTFLSIKGLVEE